MSIVYSKTPTTEQALELVRRGFEYGYIRVENRPVMPTVDVVKTAWANDEAIFLPGILTDVLSNYQAEITQAHQLMEQTREGVELAELFAESPYAERLEAEFSVSGSSFEEHDDQGIEKVYFDAWQEDDIVADNLWCKASWLSFDEEEGSLRFRFSFGIEGYEDVASDPERERWAAKLTDTIFPESAAVTDHAELNALLATILKTKHVEFAERIVYFNAPNGGAQMHHDVERGHEGVVFAQMSGATFWLALAKPTLLDEIDVFLAQAPASAWAELRALAQDRQALNAYLDESDHEIAEQLLDRCPEFFQHLIERGYAHVLEPGDVLLMPQRDLATCVWHSVICLGDAEGEGLSFALTRHQVLE